MRFLKNKVNKDSCIASTLSNSVIHFLLLAKKLNPFAKLNTVPKVVLIARVSPHTCELHTTCYMLHVPHFTLKPLILHSHRRRFQKLLRILKSFCDHNGNSLFKTAAVSYTVYILYSLKFSVSAKNILKTAPTNGDYFSLTSLYIPPSQSNYIHTKPISLSLPNSQNQQNLSRPRQHHHRHNAQ